MQDSARNTQLPPSLGLFVLSDILLLPSGQVPLTIFEPRYINLIQDALTQPHRMIGWVMSTDSGLSQASSSRKPELQKVGCAGKITSFEELADGRFNITLTGYCRFGLVNEIPSLRGYRVFEVDWDLYKNDISIDPHIDVEREQLIASLKQFAELSDIPMDWTLVSHMPNYNLVNFFASALPFSRQQRQQLLESKDDSKRGSMLIEYVDGLIEDTGQKI